MQCRSSPLRRALALFLVAQPVFWTSDVARAQALESLSVEARPRPAFEPPGEPVRPPERAPAQAGSQPLDEPLDPGRYVLGPGDVLELRFWGVENFRLRVTMDLEGRAFVAKVGYLDLNGKTLAQAQQAMRASVARYFPKLEFGVTLVEPRTFLVQVVDAVARPGPQPATALDRVSRVIARSGGLGPRGSQRRIRIQRRNGAVHTADLLLYSITGDVKYNPYVLDGDVVRVPFEELVVRIGGAVNRTGSYELVGPSDLAELVELAGGLAPGATRDLPVAVVRRGPAETSTRLAFDFGPDGRLPQVPLSREDEVWISSFSELQQSVTIIGAIPGAAAASVASGAGPPGAGTGRGTVPSDEAAATRRLPYARGDTVRSILEKVGGPGPLADLRASYIIRNRTVVPVDLYAIVMLRDLGADRPVELGDTIVLPFRRESILVEGAVFKPGPYPYNPSYGVVQYLSLAGGLNRFAQDIEEVYVVTSRGETRVFSPDMIVEPGASVVVPERDFSRSEVVSLVLAGVGILLSAVTVFVTLRK